MLRLKQIDANPVKCALGLVGHDRRTRIQRRQVDQNRALLDVMTLSDIRILVIQNQAFRADR